MSTVTGSLGFRLIVASFLVVSVFIFIAGVSVYKISQDAIKLGSMEMIKNMSDRVRLRMAREESIEAISDTLVSLKIKKSGAVWLMDKDGYLLYHPDPVYREEYIKRNKPLGNVIVNLQYAKPRQQGGTYKEKFIDIIAKYDEGFGTYEQFGETKVIAFQVLKEKQWLIGLDEPQDTAFSELRRIRQYILYTGLISAVLILLFTWLAIRIIVKPYYREVEDLNVRLQAANRQLTDVNVKLDASNKKLTSLYKISITMQETMSLEDILDLIVSGAQEVLNVDRINIMLPIREETILECRAASGAGDQRLSDIVVPISSKGGALAAAYKRGQIIKVGAGEHIPPNFRLAPPFDANPFLRSSNFVILPMVVKNKAVGIIALDNKFSKVPITDDMVNLIQVFANQAAVAVENARLYEDLKRNIEELDSRLDQLSIVNQISNTMQKMVKRKEMLGFILRGLKESMGFDTLAVCLIDRLEDVIRGEVSVNLPEEKVAALAVPLGMEENILAATISRGLPESYCTAKGVDFIQAISRSIEEAGLKESSGACAEGTTMAMAVIPIRVLEDVVGVVVLARTRRNLVISKKEMELLMHFTNTAGMAVERADLYEKVAAHLESFEITDHLTRLFTFKYGEQRLKEEIIRSRETNRPLTMAVLGIDNFKKFNERCGQEQGDKAFTAVAHMVKMVLFENDLAFRYGGRLICCLLQGKSKNEAQAGMEKLCRLVAGHRFGGGGAEDERLTISVGLREFGGRDDAHEPAELFKLAMANLHRAEDAGGNRVFAG